MCIEPKEHSSSFQFCYKLNVGERKCTICRNHARPECPMPGRHQRQRKRNRNRTYQLVVCKLGSLPARGSFRSIDQFSLHIFLSPFRQVIYSRFLGGTPGVIIVGKRMSWRIFTEIDDIRGGNPHPL